MFPLQNAGVSEDCGGFGIFWKVLIEQSGIVSNMKSIDILFSSVAN